jgi:ABC-type multidrug transport system ATPase subunit
MGPSGSGKSTFLDCITGRRVKGRDGEIYINGIQFESQRKWYLKRSGYLLQLATQYYEELTVRDNLLLAALMSLPKSLSEKERFERVERVIEEVQLTKVKDVVVGGSVRSALSGGQKRRLAVAVQLLRLPEVLFLDEPTSGLDSASSLHLLERIRCLAHNGRLVVLTIHQPSLEIFHLFDRLLLLCQGQVAYFGSPFEALPFFTQACEMVNIPVNDENRKNPADSLMDLLGSERHRKAILHHYKETFEQEAVKNAINEYKRESSNRESDEGSHGGNDSGLINRFIALETRACLRTSGLQTLYLPMIFSVFTMVIGLAYLQADSLLLIMAAFSVFSFSSSIFVFPPVYNYLSKALEVHDLERHHGIGRAIELLIQTFLHYVAISAIPLTICSIILYLMIMPSSALSSGRMFSVALFTLALNQTWTSIAIMLVCVFPVYAHKISPLVSCVSGFAGGFFIPPSRMKVYFEWLMYINPSYYGYTGLLRTVLPSVKTECHRQSEIECFTHTGEYWIEDFGIQNVKPHVSLLILLVLTTVFLFIAWIRIKSKYWERTVTLEVIENILYGIIYRVRKRYVKNTALCPIKIQ